MTTNSSNSSNPSAGTARPPAAPHPLAAIDNIFRFAREECYPDELEIVEAAEAYVAALRSALAERDAECERLRHFAGLAIRAVRGPFVGNDWDGGDVQDAMLASGLLEARQVAEPCGENCVCAEVDAIPGECYFVTELGERASAAVAPAARETQETTDND